MTKNILSGSKFNNKHQTFVPGSESLLSDLKELSSVRKIFLGEINTAGNGVVNAKIKHIDGHFIEIVYRSRLAIQLFRLVSDDLEAVSSVVAKYTHEYKKKMQKKSINKPKVLQKKKPVQVKKRILKKSKTIEPDVKVTIGELFPELKLAIQKEKIPEQPKNNDA
jgi:hypothetical protein